MSDPDGLSKARVFLAVWPDTETRQRLRAVGEALRTQLNGRLSRSETIHLTLVFIGDVLRDTLPEVLAAPTGVSRSEFEICFDRPGYWKHNRIAYLSPSSPPAALHALVRDLEERLEALAIPYDRREYKPHITLIRKVTNPAHSADHPGTLSIPDSVAPIRWPVREFQLVESRPNATGAHYRVLARYPLGKLPAL